MFSVAHALPDSAALGRFVSEAYDLGGEACEPVPLLAAARQLWFMGQLADPAANYLGHAGLDAAFFARQTDVLRSWLTA